METISFNYYAMAKLIQSSDVVISRYQEYRILHPDLELPEFQIEHAIVEGSECDYHLKLTMRDGHFITVGRYRGLLQEAFSGFNWISPTEYKIE